MPSTFMQGPPQETAIELKSGLRVQCFRRDPSRFFVDIQKWFEALDLQSIENWSCSSDSSGHLTLLVAYRPNGVKARSEEILNDTVGLVCDLSEQVQLLTQAVARLMPAADVARPPVSSNTGEQGGAGVVE